MLEWVKWARADVCAYLLPGLLLWWGIRCCREPFDLRTLLAVIRNMRFRWPNLLLAVAGVWTTGLGLDLMWQAPGRWIDMRFAAVDRHALVRAMQANPDLSSRFAHARTCGSSLQADEPEVAHQLLKAEFTQRSPAALQDMADANDRMALFGNACAACAALAVVALFTWRLGAPRGYPRVVAGCALLGMLALGALRCGLAGDMWRVMTFHAVAYRVAGPNRS